VGVVVVVLEEGVEGEVCVLKWPIRSSLLLNRRPQNSPPLIQLQTKDEAPVAVAEAVEVDGGGAIPG